MANSVNTTTDILTSLQLETSKQKARNVGGDMGKNDFLMLLAAQLRYQDPLEPLKDTEFVAQLAQFSSLEQMQNMTAMLTSMANYQSYSMIGKLVAAKGYVDGVMMEVMGIVDGIFTDNGVAYAQIGDYVMPVSTITDVFDGSVIPTPKMLIEISNSLIGRTVKADIVVPVDTGEVDDDGKSVMKDVVVTVEGVVTRVAADNGAMVAYIDDGNGSATKVPVGSIYDIRQTGTPGDKPPAAKDPEDPPPAETESEV